MSNTVSCLWKWLCWLLQLHFTKDPPLYQRSYASPVLHLMPSCSRLISCALACPRHCGHRLSFHIHHGDASIFTCLGSRSLMPAPPAFPSLKLPVTPGATPDSPRVFAAVPSESSLYQETLGQGPPLQIFLFFLGSGVDMGLDSFLPFKSAPFTFWELYKCVSPHLYGGSLVANNPSLEARFSTSGPSAWKEHNF